MRISRNTIWITFPAIIATIIIAAHLEFVQINLPHRDFYINVCLGIFASALLTMIAALIQYFRIKTEHFHAINSTMCAIKSILSIVEPSRNDNLSYHIIRIRELETDYNEMIMKSNDFHTLFRIGFMFKQIQHIKKFTMNKEFRFWIDFKTAKDENELKNSFIDAVSKYKKISNEFSAITTAYNDYTDKLLNKKGILKNWGF